MSSSSPTSLQDVKDDEQSTWRLAIAASAPMLLITLLFPISTALVVLAISSLPISASLPRTIPDLAQLGRELQAYSQSGVGPQAHVLAVLAVTTIWKHAWSIPGSVLLNILSGTLLNPLLATVSMTLLTAVGSLMSTLLSTPMAPLLSHLFPKALSLTRSALQGSSASSLDPKQRTPAWVRLSVLRLIGIVPWSGINVACGVCGVAFFDCFLGAFLGTLPWTAVTCQVGDIMQSIASSPSATTSQSLSEVLASPHVLFKLVFLSVLSLGPILARERLRVVIAADEAADKVVQGDVDEESGDFEKRRARRWAWTHLRRSRSITRASFSLPAEEIPLADASSKEAS